MYRAMIVDDEQWVVQNLLDSVHWPTYGFEIIGTETQSPKALAQIRNLKPDLVFIDIRMPEISGLEVINKCRELYLHALFIVVSGFAEFSYVQKCMNLGAIGYCLKPIEEDEIIPQLKKAKEILDKRSEHEDPSILDWIMEESDYAKQRLDQCLEKAGLHKKSVKRAIVCLNVENSELLRHYRHLKISSGSGRRIYIAEENSRVSLYDHLLRETGKYRGIGLSRLFYQAEEVKQAIEDAEMAAYQYFICGKPTVYQASVRKGFFEFRQLFSTKQRNDVSEWIKLFDHCARLFETGNYQIQHAFFLYNTVITTILQSQKEEIENPDPYLLIDFERLIERYEDVNDLIRNLKRMTTAYLGGIYREGQIRNEAFLTLLQYVNSNYHLNLSLQLLSDEFYMNRNYISQLFIKHLGQSFTDYLAELRIRHACELLANSNLPVQGVGERVGYPDGFYFSKIFKKIVGKTPRQYRISQ
jgi:two-component system response regulator YesN